MLCSSNILPKRPLDVVFCQSPLIDLHQRWTLSGYHLCECTQVTKSKCSYIAPTAKQRSWKSTHVRKIIHSFGSHTIRLEYYPWSDSTGAQEHWIMTIKNLFFRISWKKLVVEQLASFYLTSWEHWSIVASYPLKILLDWMSVLWLLG